MKRTKEASILTDEELTARSRNNSYERRERIQNAITDISLIAVYIVPVVFVVLVMIVFYNLLVVQDFTSIQRYMEMLGAGVFGYLLAYLQKQGVDRLKE